MVTQNVHVAFVFHSRVATKCNEATQSHWRGITEVGKTRRMVIVGAGIDFRRGTR
jgi:hypothetical protein